MAEWEFRAFIESERILPTILTSAPGSTSNPNKQFISNPNLCGDYVTRAEFYLSRGLNFQGHIRRVHTKAQVGLK